MIMKVSVKKLRKYLLDPDYRFTINAKLGFYNNWDDVRYLKRMYRAHFGKELNLDNPRTFNEKLQWLKLYDRKPEYVQMVDKYEAKKYVANIIGEEYIIPTLGVWEQFDDIDFDKLPNQFVLKCTHDSGGLVICKEKTSLDIHEAKRKIVKCLNQNYYLYGREWPYKNVKPRIIAEKYMVDESGYELKDYKVFNFSGKAKFIQVDYNRFSGHMRNLYSAEWKFIEAALKYPNDLEHQIPKPEKIEEMITLAEKLSTNHPFLRTDFYSIEDKLYFGEMTFYPEAGFGTFNPEEFGLALGEYIEIPNGGGTAER